MGNSLVKQWLFFLLLLLPMALFQNCAKVNFTNIGASLAGKSSDTSADGNGTSYGGKISGEYYRFEPNFACEGKSTYRSVISASDAGINFAENKKLLCATSSVPLKEELIDRSIYQNDIVGFEDGIFESEKSVPTSIPANLVEVWCRDSQDQSGIETITHYDRISQIAVTRILYAGTEGAAPNIIPDFKVSRVVSSDEILVKDEKDFNLVVYRNKPAAQPGQFLARLQAVVGGQSISRMTSCRLGGSLSTNIWPTKQVIDVDIANLKLSPDQQSFGYNSVEGATTAHLFLSSLNTDNQIRVSPNTLARGVINFEFTPDSKSFVYWADQRIANIPELFKSNLDGSAAMQLNSALNDQRKAQIFKIEFSADGSRVLYQDGHQLTFVDNEMSVNSVSLAGGIPITLNPAAIGADESADQFVASKSLNKVAYLNGFAFNYYLYIIDSDGKNMMRPSFNFPSSTYTFSYGTTLKIPEPGNYVWVEARTYNPYSNIFSAVALDTGIVTQLPPNWNWVQSNKDGVTVLIANNLVKGYYRILNLKTGSFIELQNIQPDSFSKDGLSLIAKEPTTSGSSKQVSIDVLSGQKSSICPQASSSVIRYNDLGQGKWLIASWNEATEILNIFVQENGLCALKNSIPTTKPQINLSLLTTDNEKAIVSATVKVDSIDHDKLFFIPLNGRPALQMNSPSFIGAKIKDVFPLSDSKTVLYTGDQATLGKVRGYLWKAPQ